MNASFVSLGSHLMGDLFCLTFSQSVPITNERKMGNLFNPPKCQAVSLGFLGW